MQREVPERRRLGAGRGNAVDTARSLVIAVEAGNSLAGPEPTAPPLSIGVAGPSYFGRTFLRGEAEVTSAADRAAVGVQLMVERANLPLLQMAVIPVGTGICPFLHPDGVIFGPQGMRLPASDFTLATFLRDAPILAGKTVVDLGAGRVMALPSRPGRGGSGQHHHRGSGSKASKQFDPVFHSVSPWRPSAWE